jgi:hypothetical protein
MSTSRLLRGASPAAVTKALPAAAANNTSASIDLGVTSPGLVVSVFDVKVSVPALPALVEAKTVTIKFQDSANGTDFTDIAELASFVITGGTGNGAAATSRTVKLPPTVRRYIAINQAVLTAGGDNTGVSTTLELLY